MTEPLLPLPDDIRTDVRNVQHPNREAEDHAVSGVDAAVFDRARQMESVLVDHGEVLLRRIGNTSSNADMNVQNVTDLAQGLRSGDVDISQDAARSYEALRGRVADNVAELQALRAQIAHAADRCESPLEALQSMLSRFPALRSGRGWVPPYVDPRPRAVSGSQTRRRRSTGY